MRVLTDNNIDGVSVGLSQDNKLITFNSGNSGSGINLSNIPEKPFETGSTVLAYDPSGQLYKFQSSDEYLKDVQVKVEHTQGEWKSDENGTEWQVTVYLINLKNKPVTGQYQFNSNAKVTVSVDEEVTLEPAERKTYVYKLSNTEYSTATASMTVEGDTNQHNNSATVYLNPKSKPPHVKPNFTTTENCPFITATLPQYDNKLVPFTGQSVDTDLSFNDGLLHSLVIKRENLNGLQIKFDGASSVKVFGILYAYNDSMLYKLDNTEKPTHVDILEYKGLNTGNAFTDHIILNNSQYNFDVNTQLLTITNVEEPNLVIYVRPAGADCKWQAVKLNSTNKSVNISYTENRFIVSGLDSAEYTEEPIPSTINFNPDDFSSYGTSEEGTVYSSYKSNPITIYGVDLEGYKIWKPNNNNWQPKIEFLDRNGDTTLTTDFILNVNIPKGTAKTFEVTYPFDIADWDGKLNSDVIQEQQGNLTIEYVEGRKVRFIVSENATETDNFISNKLNVRLV